MKKVAVSFVVLLLALPALAKKVSGVEFPAETQVAGQVLHLNGAGLRKKLWIEVYAAGLYVVTPSKDAQEIITDDAPKSVRMVFLHDVSKKQMKDAFREGFENNSKGPELSDLLGQLERLDPALGNMKKGDEMEVSYLPGQGTTVTTRGVGSVRVVGKPFADALFRNWLGNKPADDGLKKALLGR